MAKERKIYTGFGDRGRTSLLGGEIVEKDDLRVNAYGALDELQSALGVARSLVREEYARSILFAVQKDLFVAGSELASTSGRFLKGGQRITTGDVKKLEKRVDQLTGRYGLPGGFVIPGESLESAAVHLARSICRRVERLIVGLHRRTRAYEVLIVYFNRLSDLLFVLAWSMTVDAAIEEVLSGLMPDSVKSAGK